MFSLAMVSKVKHNITKKEIDFRNSALCFQIELPVCSAVLPSDCALGDVAFLNISSLTTENIHFMFKINKQTDILAFCPPPHK